MICLDLDGVLYDFFGTWTAIWQADHGPIPQLTHPQPYNHMATLCGMGSDAEWWAWFRSRVGFRLVRPYPWALDAANLFTSAGIGLCLATSRPPSAEGDTLDALAVDFPHLPAPVFTTEKQTIAGVRLWVDDHPATLETIATVYGPAAAVAIRHPWMLHPPAGAAMFHTVWGFARWWTNTQEG